MIEVGEAVFVCFGWIIVYLLLWTACLQHHFIDLVVLQQSQNPYNHDRYDVFLGLVCYLGCLYGRIAVKMEANTIAVSHSGGV